MRRRTKMADPNFNSHNFGVMLPPGTNSGQYATIGVAIDGDVVERPYSIVSHRYGFTQLRYLESTIARFSIECRGPSCEVLGRGRQDTYETTPLRLEEFHMMRGTISIQHLPQLEGWRGLVK